MSPVQEKYEFVVQEAERFLAPEGFHRSKACLRKCQSHAEVRWSLCFEKSRRSTAEHIQFTADVSVQWKRRPAWYEDLEPHTAWYGGAGDRIGFLTPKKNDAWWDIDSGTSAELLSDQFNAVLASCVLPFFRRFQTEQEIESYYRTAAEGELRWNYCHQITMLARLQPVRIPHLPLATPFTALQTLATAK